MQKRYPSQSPTTSSTTQQPGYTPRARRLLPGRVEPGRATAAGARHQSPSQRNALRLSQVSHPAHPLRVHRLSEREQHLRAPAASPVVDAKLLGQQWPRLTCNQDFPGARRRVCRRRRAPLEIPYLVFFIFTVLRIRIGGIYPKLADERSYDSGVGLRFTRTQFSLAHVVQRSIIAAPTPLLVSHRLPEPAEFLDSAFRSMHSNICEHEAERTIMKTTVRMKLLVVLDRRACAHSLGARSTMPERRSALTQEPPSSFMPLIEEHSMCMRRDKAAKAQ